MRSHEAVHLGTGASLVDISPTNSEGREPWNPAALELGRAHSARMYDYFLGGKDNFRADRHAATKVLSAWPGALVAARSNRTFMHRCTRALVRRGIRQFLDIGTGIPTVPNLHEIAQALAPESRVVYVDNDPIVLAHAQALMTSSSQGHTAYIQADVTRVGDVLDAPELALTLDFSRPIAVSLNALAHFIPDDQNPHDIVRRLMDAVPSGSYLCMSHITADFAPSLLAEVEKSYRSEGIGLTARTKAQFAAFFEGCEVIEPGLVPPDEWQPEEDGPRLAPSDFDVTDINQWVGVARKV